MPKLKPFFWCLLIAAANAAHSDDCRIMNFNPHTTDKVLVNHIIRSMNLRNRDMCEIRCYRDPNCVSYNYGPMQTGTPLCELNNRTYLQVSSDDFIIREGYTYRDVLNPCHSSPCANYSTCQAGFGDRGYRCVCPLGYQGDKCQLDIDECNVNIHDCSSDADCSNVMESYQCACKPGFTGDGKTCQDLDECTLNTHDCSSNADCSNILGSFQCACNPGFTGDGKTCQDIDECSFNTHDCSSDADCSNGIGSYKCACKSGFTGDGKTCQAILLCQSPWITFQGSCYALFTELREWSDASTFCKSQGAQLAKVESSDENDFIKQNFLSSSADYWIGLTDEQTELVWKWSDGSPLTGYSNWQSGQPSDSVHYQNCVGIRKSDAFWHDKPCTEWKGCICKK